MSDFVHLHVRTEYSMLEGAVKLSPLIGRLKEFGNPAVALTDIGTMMPAIEFQFMCKKAELQPILGTEFWCASERYDAKHFKSPRFDKNSPVTPVVALCASLEEGYRNICHIISLSHKETYFNARPRVDRELLRENHEGLIFLSGGYGSEIDSLLRAGDADRAREIAVGWRDLAGPDNFFLELNHHGLPEDDAICEAMAALGQELSIPLVATNSVKYLNQEDHEILELLTCIRTGRKLDDPDLERLPNHEFYLKSPDQMREIFARWPEACDNTLKIAERCQVQVPTKGYFYPKAPLPEDFHPAPEEIPEGWSIDDLYLSKLTHEGLKVRYPDDDGTALKRLEYELEMMRGMHVAGYMLIVADFIRA